MLLPFNRNPNPVISEPSDNVYGPFKVLRRTDNRFVVHDTRQVWPMRFGRIFHVEWAARAAAKFYAEREPATEEH
jgi:hypothetical protein